MTATMGSSRWLRRFIVLVYPAMIGLLYALAEMPWLLGVVVGENSYGATIRKVSYGSFVALQHLTLPARILNDLLGNNPYWMKPGATFHHSHFDLFVAFIVSLAVWVVLVLACGLILKVFKRANDVEGDG